VSEGQLCLLLSAVVEVAKMFLRLVVVGFGL
jgi:hypothetical protein